MSIFDIFKKDKETLIKSPVNGLAISLNKVPDNIFSSGMMGKGLGFVSKDAKVFAPCDGKIVMIAPTKHAIGIRNNGIEILIHVGMDSCSLNGEGLNVLVKTGEQVREGDLLLTYNLEYMKEKGIDMTIPMVITNSNECNVNILYEFGDVNKDSSVIKAKKNESN